jgi:hypothetical protein
VQLREADRAGSRDGAKLTALTQRNEGEELKRDKESKRERQRERKSVDWMNAHGISPDHVPGLKSLLSALLSDLNNTGRSGV